MRLKAWWKEQADGLKGKYLLWMVCGLLVLALGLWHVQDVGAGALQTGDFWLYGWYGGLLAAVTALLSGGGFLLFLRKSWKLEKIFACVVFSLGLLYLLVLAPLSAPDEISHFISAYELSSQIMGQPSQTEDGKIYIRAQDAFIEDIEDVMADDGSGEKVKGETALVLGHELTEETYHLIRDKGIFGTGQKGLAVSYQPSVRTTPLAYGPQALGITIGRLAGLGGIGILYLGRLFNLIFYVLLGGLTIRKMPFGKEVFFGVSLLPMSLHLAASFSYDVMILSMSGFFMAVCLDLAYKAKKVTLKDIAVLSLVIAVMGPCKMVYGAIVGLCLLIPVRKFGGIRNWILGAVAVLGAFGIAMVLVNRGTVSMYAQADQGYIAWAGEAGYTFSGLLHNPFHVLKMCYDTLMWQGEALYSGMLGGALGNMDAVLNTPYVVLLGFSVILVLLALKKPGESIVITVKQKLWIWFLCAAVLGALMFSMLLAWTPVSSAMIQGVQGRYLLPLLPLFLLTLKNNRVVRTGQDDRGLLYLMLSMDVYVVLRLFAVVCLRIQ